MRAVTSHLRAVLLGTTRVERGSVLMVGGIRAAVVMGLLMTAAVAAGRPSEAIPLAVGALFVAIAEVGEGVGRRWRTMAWVTLWLMASSLVAALLSDQAWAVVLASAVVALLSGFAGAAGPRAALGGVLVLVTFIIVGGAPSMPDEALRISLLMGLGGVAMTVVVVLPHVVRDLGAVRVALGEVPSLPNRLREHLSWQDPFVRHGVRLSLGIAVASALAFASGYPHAYWLPMTIAWVTKPDLEGTVSRVAARILGTVVGIAISAVLLIGLDVSGYAAAVVVALAGGVTVAFIWANYAMGVTGITVLVIVVFSLDGDSVPEDLVVRLVATLIAAAMAVAGSYAWRSSRGPAG